MKIRLFPLVVFLLLFVSSSVALAEEEPVKVVSQEEADAYVQTIRDFTARKTIYSGTDFSVPEVDVVRGVEEALQIEAEKVKTQDAYFQEVLMDLFQRQYYFDNLEERFDGQFL